MHAKLWVHAKTELDLAKCDDPAGTVDRLMDMLADRGRLVRDQLE